MFSRKQRFYEKKTFYAGVLAAFSLVMTLSLWMDGEPVREEEPWNEQEHQVASSQVETNIGQPGITGNPILTEPVKAGYLVVEEDRFIRIYQMDQSGQKTLVRTSDILYDLLGTEDQELFRAGVHLETEDQLMELLQDFES